MDATAGGLHLARLLCRDLTIDSTDVRSTYATSSEAGGMSMTAAFRHAYAPNSFWSLTIPIDLVTPDGNGDAPNTDCLSLPTSPRSSGRELRGDGREGVL